MGEKGSRYITSCFALLFFFSFFSKAVILLQQSLTFPSHFQAPAASQGHRQKHFINGPSDHKAGSEGWLAEGLYSLAAKPPFSPISFSSVTGQARRQRYSQPKRDEQPGPG